MLAEDVQIGGEGKQICSAACDWRQRDNSGAENLAGRENLKRQMQRRPPDDGELRIWANAKNSLIRPYAQVCSVRATSV